MLICKVVGHVWATKKEEGLEGLKLMVVQEIDGNGRKKDAAIVAIIDTVEVNREVARGSE